MEISNPRVELVPPNRWPRKSVLVYVLEITLIDVPVWRRVAVPASMGLPKLHQVIQAAMGWRDCHLHEFLAEDQTRYGHWLEDENPPRDEANYRLQDLVAHLHASFVYQYDFGDDWTHRVTLKEATERPIKHAEYLGGAGECPPEDCGGSHGYHEMLAALRNPEHDEHEQFRDWLPEGKFDPAGFNEHLARLRVNSIRV